ncbi:hypothetical protein KFE25_012314 [Diacronema lutheri]|uniref:RING-type domain-containing protein n=3 Tax=Diacronema lutheri TaxID=2081491 RepID=A0A8J5XAI0_DIALT|nr:hypothetical protein KFE25_012314 [Diacronema lutheri]
MRVADTLARLARAAWWAEDCVDYARLKAMIVARSRSESEREGAFFTGVLQEVQKASAFYRAAEARLVSELQSLLPRADELCGTMRALATRHSLADGTSAARERVLSLVRGETENAADIRLLARCFALSEQIESLRWFCVLNDAATTKILERHDARSRLALAQTLAAFADRQALCRGYETLAVHWADLQRLVSRILAELQPSASDEPPAVCTLCTNGLRAAVRLDCDHALCQRCRVATDASEGSRCPLCEDAPGSLEQRMLRVELARQSALSAIGAPSSAPSSGSSGASDGGQRGPARCSSGAAEHGGQLAAKSNACTAPLGALVLALDAHMQQANGDGRARVGSCSAARRHVDGADDGAGGSGSGGGGECAERAAASARERGRLAPAAIERAGDAHAGAAQQVCAGSVGDVHRPSGALLPAHGHAGAAASAPARNDDARSPSRAGSGLLPTAGDEGGGDGSCTRAYRPRRGLMRKQACMRCHRAKAACRGFPCERCVRLGAECLFPLAGAMADGSMLGDDGDALAEEAQPPSKRPAWATTSASGTPRMSGACVLGRPVAQPGVAIGHALPMAHAGGMWLPADLFAPAQLQLQPQHPQLMPQLPPGGAVVGLPPSSQAVGARHGLQPYGGEHQAGPGDFLVPVVMMCAEGATHGLATHAVWQPATAPLAQAEHAGYQAEQQPAQRAYVMQPMPAHSSAQPPQQQPQHQQHLQHQQHQQHLQHLQHQHQHQHQHQLQLQQEPGEGQGQHGQLPPYK